MAALTKLQIASAQQIATLTAKIKRLHTMSSVEMMCENYNVKCHVAEWEARCLKAEAENKRQVKEIERLQNMLKPFMSSENWGHGWVEDAKDALKQEKEATE